jgi:25S rRNA (cytosine2870-C5)-methyltransferase
MGRRAKNKQAPPNPFSEPGENVIHPSPKKLGKRKAEARETETNRPAKKAKENESKSLSKLKTGKSKDAGKGGKRERAVKVSGPEVTGGSDEASEGWEDVEDEVDLKAQTKSVGSSSFYQLNVDIMFYVKIPFSR